MYWYLTVSQIENIMENIGLTISFSLFSDFESVIVLVLCNLVYYFLVFNFVRIFYKFICRVMRFF